MSCRVIVSLHFVCLLVLAADARKWRAVSYPEQHTMSAQRAFRHIPSSAVREFARAEKARMKHDMRAFELHLSKGIEIAPLFTEALNNLGAYYLESGDLDRAGVLLNRAADSDSGCAAVALNRGILAIAKGNLAEAETFLRRAVRTEPAFPEAQYLLGAVLQKRNENPEEAVRFLRAGAERFPDAHLRAALCLYRCGRTRDAIAEVDAYLLTGDSENRALARSWLEIMEQTFAHHAWN